MRKLFFALSLVGMLMTQSLSYAKTTLNAITQETEQQEEAVAEETMAEEALVMEEAAVEEEEAAPAEASFTQELKKRFIEGGPGFMGIVLICLILGLAIAIERIIYLNLATTNSQKLTAGVEEALSSGGVEAAKELCRNTKGPVASIFYQGLDRVNEGVESAEKAVVAFKWDNWKRTFLGFRYLSPWRPCLGSWGR